MKYYDQELWEKIIYDFRNKKKIHNLHFIADLYKILIDLNKNPAFPKFQQLNEEIKQIKEKIQASDRTWRYDVNVNSYVFLLLFAIFCAKIGQKAEWRSYDELVAMRERAKPEDYLIGKRMPYKIEEDKDRIDINKV